MRVCMKYCILLSECLALETQAEGNLLDNLSQWKMQWEVFVAVVEIISIERK